jgi:hypothetical protein
VIVTPRFVPSTGSRSSTNLSHGPFLILLAKNHELSVWSYDGIDVVLPAD